MENNSWNITFLLPDDFDRMSSKDEITIKKSCRVELEMEYDKLFLIMSNNDIKFISEKIHDKDKKSFIRTNVDYSKYKTYKVESKIIDIDNNRATIVLKYT